MGGRAAFVLALVMLSLFSLAGCGGSSSSSTGAATGSTAAETTEASSTSSSESAASETRTSPPTKGFSKKAKQAAFGYEAGAKEREEASEILEESLQAREGRDYKTQCETLGQKVVEAVEKSRYHVNCPGTLKIEDLLIPPPKTSDTMAGPIVALRVSGSTGYALYHGKNGNDYAMRMEKEDGKWKVGEVLTEKLP